MARKKIETPEQTLDRWFAESSGRNGKYGVADVMEAGWEPGQVTYLECYGSRYEKFPIGDGYVVIEWDDSGNITVG